ncbi:hypothetical protein ANO11243_009500 [Dothideomycetidae sp. 11243]|nr:hypothetical protein ANO11243_009500 [fungal sp. No.11243]
MNGFLHCSAVSQTEPMVGAKSGRTHRSCGETVDQFRFAILALHGAHAERFSSGRLGSLCLFRRRERIACRYGSKKDE